MGVTLKLDVAKGKRAIRRQARKVGRAMGEHFVDIARLLCPKDTGLLETSIGYEHLDDWTVRVFASTYYAAYVEFGHMVTFVHGMAVAPIWIEPNPFFRTALDDTGRTFSEFARLDGIGPD